MATELYFCLDDSAGIEWLGLNELTIVISGLALAFGSYFVSI